MKINQIKNIFPNVSVARYNLGVWQQSETNSLCFICREVEKAGEIGQPDVGKLKLFEVDNRGGVINERIIWEPLYDGINLEDPRILHLPNENLIIGLTCVLRDKNGSPVPFPGIVKIDYLNSWKQRLPPFLVVDSFGPGKNITPITTNTYFFRPEQREYNHKLLVFTLDSQIPTKCGDLTFPDTLPWAQWRIGTTMPPIWITDSEALFIIHGISVVHSDGKDKYVYSIGRAKLTRSGNSYSVAVSPEPILTPDNFLDANGQPLVDELHPELRRVVYSCGGIIKKDQQNSLSLYVNVGDRATFEVEFLLEELMRDLF